MRFIFALLIILFTNLIHASLYLNNSYYGSLNIGVPFSEQLNVYNNNWILQSNNITYTENYGLPPGITINSSGLLNGTPTASGYFSASLYLYDTISNNVQNYVSLEFNVNDDIIDEDLDGMSDIWEASIVNAISNDVITSIFEVLRDDNFDGDAYSNIEEYLLGFDPLIIDGNEPDSVIEGLLLVRAALSNDYDSVYVDLINECFTKALAQEPGNYRIRVYRALANIFLLAQREELHDLVEDFGYFLTDERVHGETEALTHNNFNFDFDNSPSIDFAKGVLFSNVVTLIDQSLDDLNYVPDGWTSYVEFSSVYFRSDDTVYVDAADIIALKGILNLFKSYLLTFSAYEINHPAYREMVMPNVVTNAIINLDGNNSDWENIDQYMIGSQKSIYQKVKFAKNNTNLYYWVDFKMGHSFEKDGFYVAICREEEAHDYETSIFSNTDVITNLTYSNSFEGVVYLDQSYSNSLITIDRISIGDEDLELLDDLALDKNPFLNSEFLSTANTNLMAKAKEALQMGINLFQLADQKINSRTDLLMHLIEYELDEEFVEEREEFISVVQDFENYLTSTNDFIFSNQYYAGYDEVTYESIYTNKVFTNEVYLGAFYKPDFVDLSLLPESDSHLDHPRVRELPDPTFGGVFPLMNQERIAEIWDDEEAYRVASVEIIGTNVVAESSQSQYQVIAHYFNGTSEDWTEYSEFVIINNTNYYINGTNGTLTTPTIFSDESIVLTVDLDDGYDLFMIDLPITIKDMELREALDNYEMVWSTGGTTTNQGWSGQGFDSYDGEDAAKSGTTFDNGISWVEASTSGSGTLSFWYKISSEPNADRFQFSIDGENPTIISFGGEQDWIQETFEVSSNSNHVFRWEYVKDKNTIAGQDSVWIDQVTWSGSTNVMNPGDCFPSWAEERGLSADTNGSWRTAFMGDIDGDGIPNGIEYSFGSNMSMRIKIIHDEPGLQVSEQLVSTTNYVDVSVHATTNLTDWDLEVSEIPGAPDGHKWYAPTNIPNNAFYKVDALMRETPEN